MKYIIFDFGKVLGYPISGNWFVTNKFRDYINKNVIDIDNVKESIIRNRNLVQDDLLIKTIDEEYEMFKKFYRAIFDDLGKPFEDADLIAHDRVYNFNNYSLYDDVKDNLIKISKKYKLLMLTNNWPNIIDFLKENEIYNLFDKVYVSSIYGEKKENGKFFDIMIDEYNIKENEATFIDDNEKILDIAKTKNLNVILMDRDNKLNSKYKRINNLNELNIDGLTKL